MLTQWSHFLCQGAYSPVFILPNLYTPPMVTILAVSSSLVTKKVVKKVSIHVSRKCARLGQARVGQLGHRVHEPSVDIKPFSKETASHHPQQESRVPFAPIFTDPRDDCVLP